MAQRVVCISRTLAAGGELLVRSRAVTPTRVAVDVTDRAAAPVAVPVGAGDATADGDNAGEVVHRTGHAGIGLELVRSLVARELGGRFELTRAGGGTTATVEFPLDQQVEPDPQQEVPCHP